MQWKRGKNQLIFIFPLFSQSSLLLLFLSPTLALNYSTNNHQLGPWLFLWRNRFLFSLTSSHTTSHKLLPSFSNSFSLFHSYRHDTISSNVCDFLYFHVRFSPSNDFFSFKFISWRKSVILQWSRKWHWTGYNQGKEETLLLFPRLTIWWGKIWKKVNWENKRDKFWRKKNHFLKILRRTRFKEKRVHHAYDDTWSFFPLVTMMENIRRKSCLGKNKRGRVGSREITWKSENKEEEEDFQKLKEKVVSDVNPTGGSPYPTVNICHGDSEPGKLSTFIQLQSI